MTDAELIAAYVRDGGEGTFLAIYDRHAAAMYALALRLLARREAEAADALQDAWLRILPRLRSFRGESALRTWLCGFVVNCCRERFRMPLSDAVDDQPPLVDRGYEPSLDLERALAALADGYRAIVVLHDVEGYTHHEIAAALGIDEGTSKSQLCRGRRALRRLLQPGALTR